ncbi:hypothetical protein MHZ92_07770 [Sporosarcina sp. ACRSL]|uniref:hypothetical protein n=1 Tax=Sporosarcina sp. ACRSL TaxID=2918215 RepID=UPI001EF5181F|nr:hypothetical protein [Sporosarcina sp. ACRSL]MCG7344025.1 hypothetical protein [Sporosarcina sp. ACRSL]
MEKQHFNLMQFFNGYVRNYRRMNLTNLHNRSMLTKREIDYFANLGEMLGFDAFIEDSKLDKSKGRSRPMDLSWWNQDSRVDTEYYLYLALHLERENVWSKDVETIEKLFTETEEDYLPHNVIGIQLIESKERIEILNDLVMQKNSIQRSNALMVYHLYDSELDGYRIYAYSFTETGEIEERHAIRKVDEFGYWYMCFEEEYEALSR